MLLLGGTPEGRHTEQHDIFFGIGKNLSDLKQNIVASWPECGERVHIDAWREVNIVEGHEVSVTGKNENVVDNSGYKLFFLNLGGYKENEFEEFHYKMLVIAKEKGEAVKKAKETAFYKHTGFKGAESHIDDKYGIDVDDVYDIEEILPVSDKVNYRVVVSYTLADHAKPDVNHLGYLMFSKI